MRNLKHQQGQHKTSYNRQHTGLGRQTAPWSAASTALVEDLVLAASIWQLTTFKGDRHGNDVQAYMQPKHSYMYI